MLTSAECRNTASSLGDAAGTRLANRPAMRCIALVVVLVGCSGIDTGMATPDASAPTPDGRTIDDVDRQMIAEAVNVGAFARINRAPYASTVGMFDINLYVNEDARSFRKIHPETSGSGVVMPVGTLIVRDVLDATGAVAKVTLMAKMAKGYDPTLGDWWFGVTDPHGVPLDDTSGPQVGRLTDCHSCHIPRATDDYLFGVPQADQ
jgi:hypothetical protein